MTERKTAKEFRETGLLWFINTTLHLFGWALCWNPDTDELFPARCKFRGFQQENNDKGYQMVSEYLKNNIDEILKETYE